MVKMGLKPRLIAGMIAGTLVVPVGAVAYAYLLGGETMEGRLAGGLFGTFLMYATGGRGPCSIGGSMTDLGVWSRWMVTGCR